MTAGLTAAEADFVKKRIAQIAADADVLMGGAACGPNFVVILTPEPEKLLTEWWSEEHRLFNRDRGLGGVNRFIQTDQPVRVWHNACNAPPGIPAYAFSTSEHCGSGASTGSRLSWAVARAVYSAIVVVDLTQIEGLTFGQVADYVAMVGLTQIRPNSELGDISTILGLFSTSGTDRSKGLTALGPVVPQGRLRDHGRKHDRGFADQGQDERGTRALGVNFLLGRFRFGLSSDSLY